MTTTTLETTTSDPGPARTDEDHRGPHRPDPVVRQTLHRAVRSEWIKIRTLRSTWIGMAFVIVLLVGLGAISAAVSTSDMADGDGFGAGSPLTIALTGADFAVLLVGVLGALAGAREYASRMISVTVTAVPRRWQVLVSKAVALTAVVLPTAVIGVAAAYAAGMGVLSATDGATVGLTDDGVLGEMAGMAAYIASIGLLGLGLGVLLRSVAGSIGVLVGGIILLPTLAGALLPASWDPALQYLPSSAAAAFTTVMGAGDSVLGTAGGVAVLGAWVVGTLAAAAVVLHRRDV